MRLSRIYTDQPLAPGTATTLGPDAARHLATVLRARAGDSVILFNGDGRDYPGTLVKVAGKSVDVAITAVEDDCRESPLITRLGIALSRGERFEWVLQKATELGVNEIFPLATERTEVKLKGDREDKKLQRWQQMIISACEQCGRNRLPTLHPVQTLASWSDIDADLRLVLHHRSALGMASLQQMTPQSVAMAIGPEGGLSETEIQGLLDKGFQALTLGPRVFRTETAPIAALSVFQTLWGDF